MAEEVVEVTAVAMVVETVMGAMVDLVHGVTVMEMAMEEMDIALVVEAGVVIMAPVMEVALFGVVDIHKEVKDPMEEVVIQAEEEVVVVEVVMVVEVTGANSIIFQSWGMF